MRIGTVISLIFLLSGRAWAAPDVETSTIQKLLETHCLKCHGVKSQKGGVNLDGFAGASSIAKHRNLWREVIKQIESGEMPPESEKKMAQSNKDRVVTFIKKSLVAAELEDRRNPDPGRPVPRRLTRVEYNRSVEQLTGITGDIASAVGITDEVIGEAFENLAVGLTIPPTLLEKYFSAAELIIEKLSTPPKNKKEGLPLTKLIGPTPTGNVSATVKTQLEKILPVAFRRPVTAQEVGRYLSLFQQEYTQSKNYEASWKPVLKAILVSPHFLIRVEKDQPSEGKKAYRISDTELAVRLSYFLWSAPPDEELRALAFRNELSRPEVYEKQVRRMLADPKAKALAEEFASQWLRLRKLPDARPSTEFFPNFTPRLREAMATEAITFFDHLRKEDRPVLELIDSDYTFVNGELARHYQIAGVSGPEFRKVKLPDKNRGGVLGMGAILSLTSHTNRTSPTLRGKYVLDVLLGTPPAPPPPDAGMIDETKSEIKMAKNFREQLALHATRAACAGCHNKIDPLGFGLESFNAVGQFRGKGKDIDTSGKLPTGETFNGPAELRKILLNRKDQFASNLVAKFMSYALGREILSSDELAIQEIVQSLQKNDYKFSTLIMGITKSHAFLHRRNLTNEDELDALQPKMEPKP